jgi:hypothetical protein
MELEDMWKEIWKKKNPEDKYKPSGEPIRIVDGDIVFGKLNLGSEEEAEELMKKFDAINEDFERRQN